MVLNFDPAQSEHRLTSDDGIADGDRPVFVQQLVAVLRRTDASMVCSSLDDALVREELLAAGFLPLPGELDADRARIILQL